MSLLDTNLDVPTIIPLGCVKAAAHFRQKLSFLRWNRVTIVLSTIGHQYIKDLTSAL